MWPSVLAACSSSRVMPKRCGALIRYWPKSAQLCESGMSRDGKVPMFPRNGRIGAATPGISARARDRIECCAANSGSADISEALPASRLAMSWLTVRLT
ncbi:hypothetical protein D3C76_1675420 [compost metagenome]